MKKLLILLVSVMLCTILMVAASATTFVNPVAPGADPFVLKDDDGMYYLYVTSGDSYGYRVFSSTNLVEWEGEGYCLIGDDVYQKPTSETYYGYWAPELIKYEGTYYMIYTANHYLGIATSDSPLGPFTNDTENAGFLFDEELDVIDGHFFRDDNGTMYLYFVTEGAATINGQSVTKGNNIWGCVIDMQTLTVDISTAKLLVAHQTGDENVAEGPFVLKNNGTYYLTFSSGHYVNTDYAVCCATSTSPLGTFTRYASPILESDDLGRTDTQNAHLYGTAHHCFTTAPNGDLIIVYHAHRNGWTYGTEVDEDGNPTDTPISLVGPRVTCIDKAGFENGVLWAGTLEKGTPTATEQDYIFGAPERETHYEGVFATVAENTIYVAHYDGIDTNAGTAYEAPVKTIEKAAELLKETGGTIAIIQDYVVDTYLDIPACDAPLIIKAADEKDKDILFSYKFMSINSDVYFDNLILTPATLAGISVIECNFNNVVFGDGISTLFTPKLRQFPYIVGGNWWYTGINTSEVYENFKYESESEVTSDAGFSVKVYSGTWEKIIGGSMKGYDEVENSAVNGTLSIGSDVTLRPAKAAVPTAKTSGAGTVVTYDEVDYAEKYQILRNGEVVGYSDTASFVDAGRVLGGTDVYTVRAYANGCCIGEVSGETAITTYGDVDGDGILEFEDALKLIKAKVNGTSAVSVLDILVLLKNV